MPTVVNAASLLALGLAPTAVPPALQYPGLPVPVAAERRVSESGAEVLTNGLLSASWSEGEGIAVEVRAAGAPPVLLDELFEVVLQSGEAVRSSALAIEPTLRRIEPDPASARLEDRLPGLAWTGRCSGDGVDTVGFDVEWSLSLRDGSSYVVLEVVLTAGPEGLPLQELLLLDVALPGARVAGKVDGSPLVDGPWFLGCEHPLASNRVEAGRARCGRRRAGLRPGASMRLSAVVGVVPEGQLRRGFLYYLERRRAHPYRQYLHYNSWYHLNIDRPDHRMVEEECLATIEDFGRELVRARGVDLDGFVWDDGWDDFDSLWEFHDGFPEGFARTGAAARAIGAAQGVWMSPWGGYGVPKERRLAYGRAQGYEIHSGGFALAGKRYGKAYRDVALAMMRRHGVDFFKFDGMGGGNLVTGARDQRADDVDAVLALTRTLRAEDPEVFISATVGTWASPWWTFFADSIWRQGEDTGFQGAGNGRERWITYRDASCRARVVELGPLYPLSSLMLHGPCIGERGNPAAMPLDERSVAHEIWSFFGSGTGLQELYISPHLLSEAMWDELAAAARWARARADVLVDTHWIGGDPGAGEPYGWAAWSPTGSVLTLRNPSDKPSAWRLESAEVFQLPAGTSPRFLLRRVNARLDGAPLRVDATTDLHLEPFEVCVFDAAPLP